VPPAVAVVAPPPSLQLDSRHEDPTDDAHRPSTLHHRSRMRQEASQTAMGMTIMVLSRVRPTVAMGGRAKTDRRAALPMREAMRPSSQLPHLRSRG
jgi:hypothetical protein